MSDTRIATGAPSAFARAAAPDQPLISMARIDRATVEVSVDLKTARLPLSNGATITLDPSAKHPDALQVEVGGKSVPFAQYAQRQGMSNQQVQEFEGAALGKLAVAMSGKHQDAISARVEALAAASRGRATAAPPAMPGGPVEALLNAGTATVHPGLVQFGGAISVTKSASGDQIMVAPNLEKPVNLSQLAKQPGNTHVARFLEEIEGAMAGEALKSGMSAYQADIQARADEILQRSKAADEAAAASSGGDY